MPLTVDEQWMLAYMTARVHSWGNVKDNASRSIKKIQNHDDFVAWVDYFLPTSRKEEVKQALITFKQSRAVQKPAGDLVDQPKVPVKLDPRAARMLVARAKKEHCSVSDYVLKKLA